MCSAQNVRDARVRLITKFIDDRQAATSAEILRGVELSVRDALATIQYMHTENTIKLDKNYYSLVKKEINDS